MKYLTDGKGHLVCYPYSKSNLDEMAKNLNIDSRFFHKTHFDIPYSRRDEIEPLCETIQLKDMIKIINGKEYVET